LPKEEPGSEPSWFGFPITLNKKCKIKRKDVIAKLYEKKIDTRLLFAGNLTKQPAYLNKNFKISGNLRITDYVMANSFWIGLHPSLDEEELSFVIKTIKKCLK
jgi:CDP-6-deoxy-D-xylo-4-hexulose-3-dehydrase